MIKLCMSFYMRLYVCVCVKPVSMPYVKYLGYVYRRGTGLSCWVYTLIATLPNQTPATMSALWSQLQETKEEEEEEEKEEEEEEEESNFMELSLIVLIRGESIGDGLEVTQAVAAKQGACMRPVITW